MVKKGIILLVLLLLWALLLPACKKQEQSKLPDPNTLTYEQYIALDQQVGVMGIGPDAAAELGAADEVAGKHGVVQMVQLQGAVFPHFLEIVPAVVDKAAAFHQNIVLLGV